MNAYLPHYTDSRQGKQLQDEKRGVHLRSDGNNNPYSVWIQILFGPFGLGTCAFSSTI
jgi:hypothetical protein